MDFKDLKYPELTMAVIVVLAIGWASAIGYTMPTFPTRLHVASVAEPLSHDAAVPSCVLTSESSDLTAGASTTIMWTSTGAETAFINGDHVSSDGQRVVAPTSTTFYDLVVRNTSGATAECGTQIVVE